MSFNRIPGTRHITGAVTDGNYFTSPNNPMDLAWERLYLASITFYNAAGAQVTPGAGTIAFTVAPDGVNYINVTNGAFNAVDAYLATRVMPAFTGPARSARIALAGITGATSFMAEVARY